MYVPASIPKFEVRDQGNAPQKPVALAGCPLDTQTAHQRSQLRSSRKDCTSKSELRTSRPCVESASSMMALVPASLPKFEVRDQANTPQKPVALACCPLDTQTAHQRSQLRSSRKDCISKSERPASRPCVERASSMTTIAKDDTSAQESISILIGTTSENKSPTSVAKEELTQPSQHPLTTGSKHHSMSSVLTRQKHKNERALLRDSKRSQATVKKQENERAQVLDRKRHPLLLAGTRAVLTGEAALKGELATIIQYNNEEEYYLVRLLGQEALKASPTSTIRVIPNEIRPAPPSAFWVHTNLNGRFLRFPASCKVVHEGNAQRTVTFALDAFAGVKSVLPSAKAIFGDDRYDWNDKTTVLAAVKVGPATSVTYNMSGCHVIPRLGPDEAFVSKETLPEVHDALLEYEVISRTEKTASVDDKSLVAVYTLNFPESPAGPADKHSASERMSQIPQTDHIPTRRRPSITAQSDHIPTRRRPSISEHNDRIPTRRRPSIASRSSSERSLSFSRTEDSPTLTRKTSTRRLGSSTRPSIASRPSSERSLSQSGSEDCAALTRNTSARRLGAGSRPSIASRSSSERSLCRSDTKDRATLTRKTSTRRLGASTRPSIASRPSSERSLSQSGSEDCPALTRNTPARRLGSGSRPSIASRSSSERSLSRSDTKDRATLTRKTSTRRLGSSSHHRNNRQSSESGNRTDELHDSNSDSRLMGSDSNVIHSCKKEAPVDVFSSAYGHASAPTLSFHVEDEANETEEIASLTQIAELVSLIEAGFPLDGLSPQEQALFVSWSEDRD